MNRWLFKSEPSVWSWDMQVARGDRGEEWDGVRNYQARNIMRDMSVGDLGFFYHSQTEKAIVGIVEVIAAAHPDSTDKTGKWDCVDIKAVEKLPAPVTLDMCRADDRLSDMVLVKNSRLSVQPVRPDEWATILDLAKQA